MPKSLRQGKTLVFIVGCQRSGTTLTGQILGAHPNAVLCDEPDGIYHWFTTIAASGDWLNTAFYEVLEKAKTKYRQPADRFPVDSHGRTGLGSSVTHLVFKAPNLSYVYDEISQLDTDTYVVSPVRDPRAVVASMASLAHIPMVENQVRLIKQHKRLAEELRDELAILEDELVSHHIKCALVWRIKSCLYQRFIKSGVPTLKVRYEDLVANPAPVCSDLADHVGLNLEDQMLAHETVFTGFGPGETDRSRPIDPLSVDRWPLRLTRAQEADILKIAGSTMEELGYERVRPLKLPHTRRKIVEAVLRTMRKSLTGK